MLCSHGVQEGGWHGREGDTEERGGERDRVMVKTMGRERESGGWWGGGGERERQNSELCYSRIEILGSSLFLQSVLAKLHR